MAHRQALHRRAAAQPHRRPGGGGRRHLRALPRPARRSTTCSATSWPSTPPSTTAPARCSSPSSTAAENRVLVPSAKIPDVMKEATVAVEDERFYEHHGVDYQGVVRAMVLNLQAGTIVQGGSTITEQYVKNAYVGDERTYTRKLREAVLAWQLEDRWSKDQHPHAPTSTRCTTAPAPTASRRRRAPTSTSTPGSSTSRRRRCSRRCPSSPPPTRRPPTPRWPSEQRNKVLQLMADQGYITQERADKQMASKLHVVQVPAELQQEHWPTTSSTTSPTARQAVRLGQGLRRRPQGHHQHRRRSGSRRPSTSSRAPPRRWTSASSRRRPWSPSTPPTATSAPWSAASTTRSRSSTSPGRPSGSRGRR